MILQNTGNSSNFMLKIVPNFTCRLIDNYKAILGKFLYKFKDHIHCICVLRKYFHKKYYGNALTSSLKLYFLSCTLLHSGIFANVS